MKFYLIEFEDGFNKIVLFIVSIGIKVVVVVIVVVVVVVSMA